jgi:hypothetical protein
MATALAAQLAQLAAGQPAQERYVRGRPSLLFDYQKAADVSAEQVLSIARAGECCLVCCFVEFTLSYIVWHASSAPAAIAIVLAAADLQASAPLIVHCFARSTP